MARDQLVDKKKAKKIAMQRRSDLIDKESNIDGMLSDSAYLSKVSAIASAHSNPTVLKSNKSTVSPTSTKSLLGSVSAAPYSLSVGNLAAHVRNGDQQQQQQQQKRAIMLSSGEGSASSPTVATAASSASPSASAPHDFASPLPLTLDSNAKRKASTQRKTGDESRGDVCSEIDIASSAADVRAPMAVLSDAATVGSDEGIMSPSALDDDYSVASNGNSNSNNIRRSVPPRFVGISSPLSAAGEGDGTPIPPPSLRSSNGPRDGKAGRKKSTNTKDTASNADSNSNATEASEIDIDGDDDGFESCYSHTIRTELAEEGDGNGNGRSENNLGCGRRLAQDVLSPSCTSLTTGAASSSTFVSLCTSNPNTAAQLEKDCARYPWYREALEELNGHGSEGYYDEEGYEAYLVKVNGTIVVGAIDNPYALSAVEWWAKEKEARIAALNARLAKAKRLDKTGSAHHSGTIPSARTKENQKVEKFKLQTSNRFGGLRKI